MGRGKACPGRDGCPKLSGVPNWAQHALVLALVAGCLLLVGRDAVRALRRQASKLAGCGSCRGCATTDEAKAQPASAQAAKPERLAFIPSDALTARLSAKK